MRPPPDVQARRGKVTWGACRSGCESGMRESQHTSKSPMSRTENPFDSPRSNDAVSVRNVAVLRASGGVAGAAMLGVCIYLLATPLLLAFGFAFGFIEMEKSVGAALVLVFNSVLTIWPFLIALLLTLTFGRKWPRGRRIAYLILSATTLTALAVFGVAFIWSTFPTFPADAFGSVLAICAIFIGIPWSVGLLAATLWTAYRGAYVNPDD